MNNELLAMDIMDQIKESAQHVAESSKILSTTVRMEALNHFQAMGFPTIKDEEWKFCNVQPFLKENYTLNVSQEPVLVISDLLQQHLLYIKDQLKGTEKGVYRLVLINGFISEELSSLPSDKGITIEYLKAEHATKLNSITDIANNPFAALNTALFDKGIYIHLTTNTSIDKPLHIIHLYTNKSPYFASSRMLLDVEQGAQLDIIETYYAQPETIVFNNAVTEIFTGKNAKVTHYDIQKGWKGHRQVMRTEVMQERNSNYANYTFNLPGGDFYRNNLSIHLGDESIESHLYGLYLTNQQQLVDNHSEVHHKMPHCESNQLYKGVMMDQSKAVFNGKIFVYEDAQKTNAFQQSNNILLSDEASINAKPQLEIYADDVKCSHGTTIGQLDEDAIFYLKSRGIGTASARKMMVNAFAFDVAEKVKHPALRQFLESEIACVMEV